MGLAKTGFYYNEKMNTAYIETPAAKDNPDLLPLIYTFKSPGKMLHSDSSPISESHLGNTHVQDFQLMYDRKHFDFI